MRKIILPVICGLLLLFSCHNGKSSEEAEKVDTIWNEKIQDTFYGCKFGEPRDSVIEKITGKGFYITGNNREDYVTFDPCQTEDNDIFEFGGLIWNYVGIGFSGNKFQSISFHRYNYEKERALQYYDQAKSRIESKYDFVEMPTDSVIYKFKKAFGKNGVTCIFMVDQYETIGGGLCYEICLSYISNKIKDMDMDEL